MLSPSAIRRNLIACLAICLAAQFAWAGAGNTAWHPGTAGHHLVSMRGVGSWGSSRNQRSAPLPIYPPSGEAGLAEASCDFYPRWTVSILAKRTVAFAGLLPVDQSRFGRAPPSLFL